MQLQLLQLRAQFASEDLRAWGNKKHWKTQAYVQNNTDIKKP